MMNKLIRKYCLIAGMFLCACAAKDQSERDEFLMDRMKEEKLINLDREFSTQNISAVQLEGFKVRGQQKVEDFIDYLVIISNSDYAEIFKNKAREEMNSMFKENSNYFFQSSNFYEILGKISEKPNGINLEWVESPKLQIPMGEIGKLQVKLNTEEKDGRYQLHTLNFNIHLMKNPKMFGEELMYVWEVKLGDLEYVNRGIVK